MSIARLAFASAVTLLATLSFGTALAGECTSAPVHAEDGVYNGCEVVHGVDYETKSPEEIPEEVCPRLCEALSEMDEMATESHRLDVEAGVSQ